MAGEGAQRAAEPVLAGPVGDKGDFFYVGFEIEDNARAGDGGSGRFGHGGSGHGRRIGVLRSLDLRPALGRKRSSSDCVDWEALVVLRALSMD